MTVSRHSALATMAVIRGLGAPVAGPVTDRDFIGVTGLDVQGIGDEQHPVEVSRTVSTASSNGVNKVISLLVVPTMTWTGTAPVAVSRVDSR